MITLVSLPRGALVPAAVDAGRDGAALRSEDAAVPAPGIRQGISRAQPARHHSPDDRRRNQNDGILRHLSLSRHQAWPDAADRGHRRAGLWRLPELDVFFRRHADLSANAGPALHAAGAAKSGAIRRSRPITPNGFWGGCGRSRPPPPAPRRWSPAASPRPISSSAMRCGLPETSGWPKISGPMSPPTGSACSNATATSGPLPRRNSPANSKRSPGGCEASGYRA